MLGRLTARRTDGDDQAGAALIIVIGLTAAMLLAVAVALTAATSGTRQAAQTQGGTRALDAAYAGVQDYIAHLNADSTYLQYGNPASAYSRGAGGSVKLPATANPAFGYAESGSGNGAAASNSTWSPVPGSASGATFRYEVDNSLYGSSGLLRVRSTGRSGAFTRTIVASIQQQGFISYLYFTNYETQDPQISGTTAKCDVYAWASRDTTRCATIQFAAGDVLEGPVRSNDTIVSCGAVFDSTVTSSNPNTPIVTTPRGCAAGNGPSKGQYLPVLAMPATNTAMKAQTYADTATNPGCLYTGPTRITLSGSGTMTVVSPWTRATAVKSDGTAASNPAPAACGSLSALHSTAGATIAVPSNNLVFVQAVPTSSGDANYTAVADTTSGSGSSATTKATGEPSSVTMAGSWASGAAYSCLDSGARTMSGSNGTAGWQFTDASGTIRFPRTDETPATNWNYGAAWDTTTPAYGCRNGDVYLSGTLSGKLTIASDNYVYATGDILYNAPTSDVLGLVGNNGVLVWNPMNGVTPLLPKNREIDAAILSPAHTFQVQNYDIGPARGTLTVNGSIAQNFRGPVGTSSGSGYLKDYGYDARFGTVTPPYYLKPTSASFRVASYASVKPAFTATGVAN